MIERASILEDGEYISTEHLPIDLTNKIGAAQAAGNEQSSFILPAEGIPLEQVEAVMSAIFLRNVITSFSVTATQSGKIT